MSRRTRWLCLWGVLGCLLGVETSTAWADGPFYYYPPYGSQRGRIVTRSGILGDRQKVRWGNGLTDNGVAFFHDAFAAAVPILQAIAPLGRDLESEEAAHSRELRSRELSAEDDALLSRARATRDRNLELLRAFGGPSAPPAGGGGDNADWDNTGEGPTAGGAPAAGGATPASEGWDNTGHAPQGAGAAGAAKKAVFPKQFQGFGR